MRTSENGLPRRCDLLCSARQRNPPATGHHSRSVRLPSASELITMRRLLFSLIAVIGLLAAGHAPAQSTDPAPEKLRALSELLHDPAIQAWVQAQAQAMPVATGREAAADGSPSVQQVVTGRLDAMRGFLRELAAAAPTLPGELRRAGGVLSTEIQEHGSPRVVVLLAVFGALGFGFEWLFWWATTGFRPRMIATG